MSAGGHVNRLNGYETNEMLVAKLIKIESTIYVAVGLYGGFKLWSHDGNRLFTSIPCKVTLTEKPYACTCVTQLTLNNKTAIICADNYGQVFLVYYANNNWKNKVIYSNDNSTIIAITSDSKGNISIAFETGEVYLLSTTDTTNFESLKAELVCKFDSILNIPCVSLSSIIADNDYLIACFINGEVKVYEVNGKSSGLIFTLSAHLRTINSSFSYKNYFITAGDDCYVNVWSVNNNTIKNEASFELTDKMPVGIEYDSSNKLLYVSCFDCLLVSTISIDLK